MTVHFDVHQPPTHFHNLDLPGGGGGGGTASLKVGTHCQTTDPAFQDCLPLSLFLPPPIFWDLQTTTL